MVKCNNIVACGKLWNSDKKVLTKEDIDKCACMKRDMCKLIIDLLEAGFKDEAINLNNSVRFSS